MHDASDIPGTIRVALFVAIVLHENVVQVVPDRPVVQKEREARRSGEPFELQHEILFLNRGRAKVESIVIQADLSNRHDSPIRHAVPADLEQFVQQLIRIHVADILIIAAAIAISICCCFYR